MHLFARYTDADLIERDTYTGKKWFEIFANL